MAYQFDDALTFDTLNTYDDGWAATWGNLDGNVIVAVMDGTVSQ